MSTGFKWLLVVILVVLVLVPVGWGLGWYATPFQVTSTQNVREQFQFGYKYYTAMEAGAQQVCMFEKDLDTLSGNARQQRQDQLLAIQTTYTQNAAAYNAAMEDAFRAKFVKPADLPDRAPPLNDMKRQACR